MEGLFVDDWQTTHLIRERVAALLAQVAAGDADPEAARQLLADLRATWVREKRWRNSAPRRPIQHTAGPVIDCREYRRSCPGYIVDRRQACSTCGKELVRGRWAMYFPEGTKIAALGTVVYETAGTELEVACGNPEGEAACAESA